MKKSVKLIITVFMLSFIFSGCSTGQKAKDGDLVLIDYVGKVDGVAFSGGTATNQELLLGSNTYIDGFEDGVVGMKLGQTKTITVTFPTNYGASNLAGKEATFEITLNKIYQSISKENAKNGDTVIIDFVGKVDGVAFSGGSATNQSIKLGSGGYIPGFEDGIIGMKTGETKTITVTFPTGYGGDLAGKEATFEITLQKMYRIEAE